MLVACSVLDSSSSEIAPTEAAPATATAPATQSDADEAPLPTLMPTATEASAFTADVATEDVATESDDAVETDPAIQDADRLLCEEIAESEAEIEAMAEQGLDVTELIEALEELREEVGTCSN